MPSLIRIGSIASDAALKLRRPRRNDMLAGVYPAASVVVGDIFREIDEELRQERLEKLWRRHGKHVIAAGVAVVLAVAGVTGWDQYRSSQRRADGARFAAAKALLADGKTADAAALFAALGRESGAGYGVLARFHAAALEAEQGRAADAARAYEAIAAASGVDRSLRDLATVLSALHGIDAGVDGSALAARLLPLAVDGHSWRHTARELLGLLAERSGDPAKARDYYRRIVDDVDAPPGVRTRATRILAILGG